MHQSFEEKRDFMHLPSLLFEEYQGAEQDEVQNYSDILNMLHNYTKPETPFKLVTVDKTIPQG